MRRVLKRIKTKKDAGVASVEESNVYVTGSGEVFLYSFGHKRPFLSMGDVAGLAPDGPILVQSDVADALPFGPAVAPNDLLPSAQMTWSSSNLALIRASFCAELSGSGYEVGAGNAPTIVPTNCTVTYIDKFTFDEAADGSFVGKSQEDKFVDISLFESMDALDSIEDESAAFFISCHVIEHVERVMQSIREMVKKTVVGGLVFMVVPDKRYIFDAERDPTPLEHFVADDQSYTREMALEHYLEFCRKAARYENWAEEGVARWKAGKDIHMHVFTPESMRQLIDHMRLELGVSLAEVIEHARPEEVKEFYVRVVK